MLFRDRHDAGRALALRLRPFAEEPGLLVLALPRGGVPVGFEVAQALGAPLDAFVVRKLGVPWHRELAMGALASGGGLVLDRALVERLGVDTDDLLEVIAQERQELARREARYRGGRPPVETRGRTVLLVDDGLATGSTMRAAVRALSDAERRPRRLVVAVPVASHEAQTALEREADEVVSLATPTPFRAVGQWYRDFSDTTDDEVRRLLAQAHPLHPGGAAPQHP